MSHKPRANDSTSPLVTRDILRRELNDLRAELRLELHEFRSDLHRALWIQGTAIVVAVSGIAAVAVAVVASAG